LRKYLEAQFKIEVEMLVDRCKLILQWRIRDSRENSERWLMGWSCHCWKWHGHCGAEDGELEDGEGEDGETGYGKARHGEVEVGKVGHGEAALKLLQLMATKGLPNFVKPE